MTATNTRARLRPTDRLRVGLRGLFSRPGRTLFTAIGIGIGIASMITVVGISASSRADLLAELDELGTDLLRIQPGQSVFGDSATLPTDAAAMIGSVPTVTDSAGTTRLSADVQRNRYTDDPNGLTVVSTDGTIEQTLRLEVAAGRMINAGTDELPVAVLGSVAAERLGITDLAGGPTVWIAGTEFQVIGILETHPLHPDLDRSVLIGHDHAVDTYDVEPNNTDIYVRVDPDAIEATRPILARMANPAAPNEVQVSRPSDALQARASVDTNLQNLLLALGGVALLVGGVGIANIMVISVIERRSEIGLRRALGATRGHIRSQFVVESIALAALGGISGVIIGALATWAYATSQDWTVSVPAKALAGGVGIALIVGAIAGLYPATRAARLDPSDAVRPHS